MCSEKTERTRPLNGYWTVEKEGKIFNKLRLTWRLFNIIHYILADRSLHRESSFIFPSDNTAAVIGARTFDQSQTEGKEIQAEIMNECASIDYANVITVRLVSPQTYGHKINGQWSKCKRWKESQETIPAMLMNPIISLIWAQFYRKPPETPIIKVKTHCSSSSCRTMKNVLRNVFCALSSGSILVTKSAVLLHAACIIMNRSTLQRWNVRCIHASTTTATYRAH